MYGGGSLTLPAVTTYTNNNGYQYLQADQYTSYDYTTETYYGSGSVGVLGLPALTSISGQYALVLAGGTGSEIDLPALTSFSVSYYGELSVTGGATVSDGSLTTLNGVTVTIDGSSTLETSSWATFTNSRMNISGGSYTFNLLTDLDGSTINLSGGAAVTLTALTSYSNPNGYDTTYLEATGGGTVLSLPELTSLGTLNSILDIWALQGGQVLIPLLATITDTSPYVQIESDGTSGPGGSGSLIDLSSLASFAGNSNYASLQVTNGASVIDPNLTSFTDVNLTLDPTVTFPLTPSETFTVTTGASITVTTGTLVEQGSLVIPDNAKVTLNGSLEVDGSGVLELTPAATLNISGDLIGNTTNADRFTPIGTVVFDNTTEAQQLEAMSADLGAEQAGFVNNFAYGTITLTSGTYLQLVDNAHNSTGTGAEAVYANGLIVPAGATLDLNGLHMYVRGAVISGSIINGTVTQIPGGGTLQIGTPVASDLTAPGAIDEWTFFGRSAETVTIAVNPGGSGANPALNPQIGTVSVELLDQFGTVLAQGSTSNGSIVTLSGITFNTDGIYTLDVSAPSGSTATGNYTVAVYDVTPHIQPLNLGQTEVGTLSSAFGIDQWTFSALAGEQVKFNLVNSSYGSEVFSLTGPGGYTAFSNLQTSSGLITLPSSGNYTLSVEGTGGTGGSYAFEIDELTVTSLTLGTIDQGTMGGSGQSALYSVVVPSSQTLFVNLQDSSKGAVNQLYAKLGAPPTPSNYTYSSITPGDADQQILVPSAAPGTWYFLVYGASASNVQPLYHRGHRRARCNWPASPPATRPPVLPRH